MLIIITCLQLYVANAGTNITWNNMRRLTQVLYPPKTKVMSDLMLAGFMDCARFLSYYGVTDRALSCLTVESHLEKSQKQKEEVSCYLLEPLFKLRFQLVIYDLGYYF